MTYLLDISDHLNFDFGIDPWLELPDSVGAGHGLDIDTVVGTDDFSGNVNSYTQGFKDGMAMSISGGMSDLNLHEYDCRLARAVHMAWGDGYLKAQRTYVNQIVEMEILGTQRSDGLVVELYRADIENISIGIRNQNLVLDVTKLKMENLRLSDNNRDLISNMDYFLGMGFVIGVSVGVAAPVIGILLNYFNQN